ncbi:hypothetical protein QQS21_004995 [Conoideocrella luteorostrata]|uniref:Uncharacterized protein n=1 Tax=Conoideocrella luteorostrata TaxID=1105319 RepID=A0AAJ0CT22_9HYPO|nr:hypothetical protein QQS21_004995 [Conoideocrella luteorostrata]
MGRRNTRNQSGNDSDPDIIAMQAPQRIYELKKQRDERAKAIVIQAEKELASVRKQAIAYKEERRQKSALKRAQRLKKLMGLVEKRERAETRMLEIVADMHSHMQQVEEMMLAGYKGRQKEAQQSLNALSDKLHQAKE